MSDYDYAPDHWDIVEIKGNEGNICNVLGTCMAGYGDSEKWRISPGITNVIKHETRCEVSNVSGSIYELYQSNQGMNSCAI